MDEQKKILLKLDKKQISLNEARLKVEHFWSGALKKAVIDGDIENGSLMAGQSVSLVKKIEPVKSILKTIVMMQKNTVTKSADKFLKEFVKI